MIKKFDEFVNEGLWAKGIERSKTGEKRKEDISKFDLYLKKVEWVDMGHPDVLFAKYDFPVKDIIDSEDDCFSFDDMAEIEKKLPRGISIMSKRQIEHLKRTCEITKNGKHTVSSKIVCEHEGNTIEFNLLNKYSFMSTSTKYYMKSKIMGRYIEAQCATIGVTQKPTYLGRTTGDYVFKSDRKEYFFKLVKSKTVNEGLWAKGINRSKTGEERLGDVRMIDKICENVSKFISEKLKIDFNKELCVCTDEEFISNHMIYTIKFNVPKIHVRPISFDLSIPPSCDDESDMASNFCDLLDGEISYGTSPSFKKFNKLFRYIIDKLAEFYNIDFYLNPPTFEGLWSKGINRSKTGEKRIGEKTLVDKFIDYIKDIEWVDMNGGELYAKYDFPELLAVEDIMEIKKQLPNNISFADKKVYDFLNRTCLFAMSETPDGDECMDAISGENENIVSFNVYPKEGQTHYYTSHSNDDEYWDKSTWCIFYRAILTPYNVDNKPIGIYSNNRKLMSKNYSEYKTLCVKLIKQK